MGCSSRWWNIKYIKFDFRNNAAWNYGGAVGDWASSTMSIKDSTFAGNYTSIEGGAVGIYGGTNTITGSTFKWNGYSDYAVGSDTAATIATVAGGALYIGGGTTTTITDSTFSHNAVTGNGGAIYNEGGLYIKASNGGTTSFSNNAAAQGADLWTNSAVGINAVSVVLLLSVAPFMLQVLRSKLIWQLMMQT